MAYLMRALGWVINIFEVEVSILIAKKESRVYAKILNDAYVIVDINT